MHFVGLVDLRRLPASLEGPHLYPTLAVYEHDELDSTTLRRAGILHRSRTVRQSVLVSWSLAGRSESRLRHCLEA